MLMRTACLRSFVIAITILIAGFGVPGIGSSSGLAKDKSYKSRSVTVTASFYCPCSQCTDGDGKTSTGRSAYKDGIATFRSDVVATGTYIDLPNSTLGPNNNGSWIKVDDTGPARKDRDIDIRLQNHEQAKRHGVKKMTVRVWEEEQ